MARVINPLLNGMSGKMGNLVFRTVNGKTFVHPYQKTDKTPSEAMSKQREKFRMMMKFLNPLRSLIKEVNNNPTDPRRRFDEIFSENLRVAVKGEYPDLEIDYPKLVLSLGLTTVGKEVTLSSEELGKLVVQWKNTKGRFRGSATDRAFLACYNEDLKTWIFKTGLANRGSKICTFDCKAFPGMSVHVYFGFVCFLHDCNSLYLGKIEIQSGQAETK